MLCTRGASWLHAIDGECATGRRLLRTLFLNSRWKNNTTTWTHLGHNYLVLDEHFVGLPASMLCLEAHIYYLFNTGKESLPKALVLISDKFGNKLNEYIDGNAETRCALETLIARALFHDLALLKTDVGLR